MNRFSPYSYRSDANVPAFPDDKPVIIFDGHCVLCVRSAHFVMRHDTHKRLRMSAAQSDLGEALYRHYGLKSGDYSSVLLIESGKLRLRSDAALRILEIMQVWRAATWLAWMVPKFLRDPVYSLVARNRLRIWGARESCFVPSPQDRERFL